MATKSEKHQEAAQKEQDSRTLQTAIGNQVIQSLGKPIDLQRLEIRSLWKDHYRVNVFVGADSASIRIAHSYFLTTDGSGKVIASNPEIARHYGADNSWR